MSHAYPHTQYQSKTCSWAVPMGGDTTLKKVINNAPPAHFSPYLQPILLWQSLSLFWLCGLWGLRFPLEAFCFALLLFYIDCRLHHKVFALWAWVLFALGCFTVFVLMPQRPAIPPWTEQGSVPVNVRVEGDVVRVQSLTDGRLRIFLQNLAPVSSAKLSEECAPLPGFAVWTWEWSKKTKQGDFSQFSPPLRPLPGQRVRLTAKIRTTEGFRNPAGSDFGLYWQSKGVLWRLWTRDTMGQPEIFGKASYGAALRAKIIHRFSEVLTLAEQGKSALFGQALAFLPALLLGEKFALRHETMEGMQALSLVHSLALSGQHLALVCFMVWLLMQGISVVKPQIFLIVPRYKLSMLCTLPLAALYLWLGNAPSSLLRAVCMLAIVFVLLWRYQVMTLRHVLISALCCICLIMPLAVYDVGLQLSILCMTSLCLVLPTLFYVESTFIKKRKSQQKIQENTFLRWARGLRRFFIHSFFISLAIQVVLLPVILLYFTPSGLFFIANCFWLPLLAFWVLPFAALGLLLSLTAAQGLAVHVVSLAAWPCEGLLHVVQFLESLDVLQHAAVVRPHVTTLMAWFILMLALALIAGRISWHHMRQGKVILPHTLRRLFLLAACLLCMAPILRYAGYWQGNLRLTMFDVGQGQAVGIVLPGGQRLLVDGGGTSSSRFDPGTDLVMPSLNYNEAPRLWAMLNTHADMDHLRGLLKMLPYMKPDFFYSNGEKFSKNDEILWLKSHGNGGEPIALYAGQKLVLPSFAHIHVPELFLEVLWPEQDTSYSKNNASLVLRLVQKIGQNYKGLALLCGDAGLPVLQALLDSGQDISAKVLVVPHHGSLHSFLPQFYKAVGAQVALISVGRQNSYGLPHYTVFRALEEQSIQVYRTDRDGAISVNFSDSLHVDVIR